MEQRPALLIFSSEGCGEYIQNRNRTTVFSSQHLVFPARLPVIHTDCSTGKVVLLNAEHNQVTFAGPNKQVGVAEVQSCKLGHLDGRQVRVTDSTVSGEEDGNKHKSRKRCHHFSRK